MNFNISIGYRSWNVLLWWLQAHLRSAKATSARAAMFEQSGAEARQRLADAETRHKQAGRLKAIENMEFAKPLRLQLRASGCGGAAAAG